MSCISTFLRSDSQRSARFFSVALVVCLSAASLLAQNLALNKPATASSLENASLSANLAVDGNAGTRWSSAFSDPQWIRIDLGSTQSITSVKLVWEAASGKNYTIDLSNDGATWTTIATKTNMANGARTDNLTGLSGSGRYIRMSGAARTTVYGYSLFEFEVYGSTITNYTLSTAVSPTGSGSVSLSPAGGTYASGTLVTATATAAAGFTFTNWSGGATGSANPVTITMNANKSVTANFNPITFTITATAGAGGIITPSGAIAVNQGANQAFSINPNTGYSIADVSVDTVSMGAISSYTFSNVTANHTINATFSGTPTTINNSDKLSISGELFDAAGQPIGYPNAVTQTIIVDLYSSATAGAKLYTETFTNVSINDGYFSIRLGEGATTQKAADVIKANNNLWVQLTVDDGTANVLAPRTPLTAAAYSTAVGGAQSGNGIPSIGAPQATIGSYYVNTADNSTWVRTQNGWFKLN